MDPTKEGIICSLVTMLQCTTRGPLNSYIVLDMLDRIQIPKHPHLVFLKLWFAVIQPVAIETCFVTRQYKASRQPLFNGVQLFYTTIIIWRSVPTSPEVLAIILERLSGDWPSRAHQVSGDAGVVSKLPPTVPRHQIKSIITWRRNITRVQNCPGLTILNLLFFFFLFFFLFLCLFVFV